MSDTITTEIVVSSGTGTASITKSTKGICIDFSGHYDSSKRVRITPPNETTTYDMTIKDGNGRMILKISQEEGSWSSEKSIYLGIADTVLIENASTNGTYYLDFDIR